MSTPQNLLCSRNKLASYKSMNMGRKRVYALCAIEAANVCEKESVCVCVCVCVLGEACLGTVQERGQMPTASSFSAFICYQYRTLSSMHLRAQSVNTDSWGEKTRVLLGMNVS